METCPHEPVGKGWHGRVETCWVLCDPASAGPVWLRAPVCPRQWGFWGCWCVKRYSLATACPGCACQSCRAGNQLESHPLLGADQELRTQHSSSALSLSRWFISLPQLVFLLLTLTHLCFQLYRMAEGGVHHYWQKPGNWLEVACRVIPFTKQQH